MRFDPLYFFSWSFLYANDAETYLKNNVIDEIGEIMIKERLPGELAKKASVFFSIINKNYCISIFIKNVNVFSINLTSNKYT